LAEFTVASIPRVFDTISPNNPGTRLIPEGGGPQPVKVAYLNDNSCAAAPATPEAIREAAR
jgi:hypothetical protein